MKFIATTVVIGSLLDSPLSILGYITFAAGKPALFGTYPIWMSALWAGFATTLSLVCAGSIPAYGLGLCSVLWAGQQVCMRAADWARPLLTAIKLIFWLLTRCFGQRSSQ